MSATVEQIEGVIWTSVSAITKEWMLFKRLSSITAIVIPLKVNNQDLRKFLTVKASIINLYLLTAVIRK